MRGITCTIAVALTVVVSLAAAPAATGADADAPGSRDPFGVQRFPRSWIVDYRRDEEVRPRELVMSRVDRIRRDLMVDNQLQVEATQESVTYEVPDGSVVADVVAHYRNELGDDLLFSCTGRDCGRSADWANQVFEQAALYGPDNNQRYAALEWQDRLVALYVIERGNKRVYAHLRFLSPEGTVAAPNALLVQRLVQRGWVVIEGVRPNIDGNFGESGRVVLAGLSGRLAELAGSGMYLVCHLYGPGETDVLLAASRRCAERGGALIAEGADDAEGAERPRVEPFGAGPLLPRSVPPAARLELVLPGGPRSGTR
jgi:hypothetical protein